MKMNLEHNALAQSEQLSALYDGQLSEQQAFELVRVSLQDEGLLQQWSSMSAIGHTLHQGAGQLTWLSEPERIALDPNAASTATSDAHPMHAATASNDGRWQMVAGVCALAAVGSLIWGTLGASGEGTPASASLASRQPSAVVQANASVRVPTGSAAVALGAGESQEATMIRNPRLDELLAAHRQFGAVSALQQPAGSLRSVALPTPRP